MTDHPLTNALAMRTAAAEAMGDYHWQRYADKKSGGKLSSPAVFTSHTHQHVTEAILALPLEADHAALLREAVKLPEIAQAKTALHEADLMLDDGGFRNTRIHKIVKAALSALETP